MIRLSWTAGQLREALRGTGHSECHDLNRKTSTISLSRCFSPRVVPLLAIFATVDHPRGVCRCFPPRVRVFFPYRWPPASAIVDPPQTR